MTTVRLFFACLAIFFLLWPISAQEKNRNIESPRMEAIREAHIRSRNSVMICVYESKYEVLNKHLKRCVISATVTEVLKGQWEIGQQITFSKYFDATSNLEIMPGELKFLFLSNVDLEGEIVVNSGDMPTYSKQLRDALGQVEKKGEEGVR